MSGLFITFEGGEGAGKTTQAELLAARLEADGRRAVRVHEPGGTPLGEYIRSWVKASTSRMTLEAELLLFAAARAQLVREVIAPWLAQGVVVISDRYADSTTVYQGYARGLQLDQVQAANAIATGETWPDLTFLLDTSEDTGLRRVSVQMSFDEEARVDPVPRADDAKRRFEELGASFHQKVRDGYLKLAKANPERWVVLDAGQPVDHVHAQVYERVQALLR